MPAAFSRLVLIAAALCPGFSPVSVWAEDKVLPLTDDSAFKETFYDMPPTAERGILVGASIAGLRVDGPPRNFDPAAIHLLIGDKPDPKETLCVKILSRDGRYSAQARYRVTAEGGPAPLIEFKTRYAKELKAYSASDMAISAQAAKSCTDMKSSRLLAADMGSASSDKKLVVQLSAGDARVRAQLGQDMKPLGPAIVCEPPASGARIGFTAECRLPLPETLKAGNYQLSIGETGSSGEIAVKTYSIVLYQMGR
jgi:hypothetical protein